MDIGFVSTVLINPFWVLKTRICVQKGLEHQEYRGVCSGLARIYRNEGIPGLYKGLSFGLIGSCHGAIQFVVYEELKNLYNLKAGVKTGEYLSNFGPPMMMYIFSAAVSKFTAMVVSYPFQVFKSTMQSHDADVNELARGVPRRTPLSVVKDIYLLDGFRGFYRGFGLSLLRTLPGSCLNLGFYELFSIVLRL